MSEVEVLKDEVISELSDDAVVIETPNVVEVSDNSRREYLDNVPNSLQFLVDGYVDYAKEVILDRAIPAIDGFKPSQRRILYAMKYLERDSDLTKELTKCAGITGTTMKIHPHGDASIYDTMVRMTDCAMYLNTPFILGKGSFGHVFSSLEKAAASRYTECMLTKVADECFSGMNGIEMIPSYDNKLKEPYLLPISYPNILCNTTQGIAVGLSSNIPSFNFHELIKATIEFIKTGTVKKPLTPDFTTGGSYIYNEHELKRLMTTGNAKLKLRGKWHIEGKIIVIDEIPYYTTLEDIQNSVKDLIGVVDVKDESDRRGMRLTIECATRKVVDNVLQEVLRVSNLQMTVSTNIVLIVDNKPVILGVLEVIEEWVKFRKGVLTKELSVELDRLSKLIERYDILVDLMTTEKREIFLETLLKDDSLDNEVIISLLSEFYPNTGREIFEWVLDRSLKSLKGVGNRQRVYLEELRTSKLEAEENISNIDKYIVSELEKVNKKYKFKRKTEVTEVDYTFEAVKRKKPEAYPVIIQVNGVFLKKLKNAPSNASLEGAIKCMSDSVVSYLDTQGRLLRVQLDSIDFCMANDKGAYLPRYFDLPEFEVFDYSVIGDLKTAYIYEDGFVSVLDYNEWFGARRKTKITEDGLASAFMPRIVSKIDITKGNLVLRTEKNKLMIVGNNFIHKKRTARTKLVRVGKGDKIVSAVGMTDEDVECLVEDVDNFKVGFRIIKKTDCFDAEMYNCYLNGTQ